MSDKNQVVTILRRKQVEARTGLSCSSIYKLMSSNSFPRPINLGGKYSVGWVESEITNWIEKRIEQRQTASTTAKVAAENLAAIA